MVKLTIIIPVYNEVNTFFNIIERVKRVVVPVDKEIIVVDDGSTDGTQTIIEKLNDSQIKVIYHSRNQGKGTAINTAQKQVTGDIVIIQDADLECQPEDYPRLIKPILEGRAEVVYGSRFLRPQRITRFWHYLGNKCFTFLTNLLYQAHLSDMETCFKVFPAKVFKQINIKSRRFDFEPEITAKILKLGLKIVEVPLTYYGRTYREGKKIGWRDALATIWALLKYRLMD
jgi:glycosyltransferase involved in cell wall biosynthesis